MSIVLGSQILICDDSELACLYAFTALSHAGFSRIHMAKTWEEAKYICWNNAIDCCVIDLLMGEGEGTGLIAELRKIPNYDRVPMIIVTASGSLEKSWSCLEKGADDFVTKPYPEKTLATRVNLHIQRYIAESRYRNLIENMSNGVLVCKPVRGTADFEIIGFNKALEQITNLRYKAAPAKTFSEVFAESVMVALLEVIQRVSATGKPENTCISRYNEDYLTDWLEFYVYRLANEEVVAVCDDLTEKMRANEELKKTTQRLQLAAEGARFGVWELNLADYSLFWDDWMYRVYGIDKDTFDLKFSSWEKMVHPEDIKMIQKRLLEVVAGEQEYDLEFRFFKPSGDMVYIKCHGVVSYTADGIPESLTGIIYDITKEKLDEIKLEEAAITDKLTGVYNRHYLYERLQELLDKHRRDDSGFAIAVFDLDYFKAINDTHGHIAGDRVLQHFAATLKSQLRSYDIVVRFGGEEFIVVFPDIAKEQAAQLCNRILAGLIETGVKIAEVEIEYSFTCGVTDIASWDHQPDGIDRLISYADDLLYKGKTNGRKQVVCG